MKRILIFGGSTGVVATQVANRLTGVEGMQPVFLDAIRPATLDQSIEWAPVPLTDVTALSAVMNNADVIVSCVESDPRLIVQSSVALFNALQPHATKRVVLLSSMAVYGASEGVIDENAALTATDDYAAARISAETLAQEHGNSICLRGGVEYGPGSMRWSHMIAKLLISRRLGDLGAAGDGVCNLLFMRDLVEAVVRAIQLTNTQHQVFNLCSSEHINITWNEYLIRYGVALGAVPVKRIGRRRLSIETKLAIPLKIAEVALGQSMAARLHIPAPIPPSMLRTFSQRIVMKVSAAEQVLGMQWTPLQEGLLDAARWILRPARV